MARITLDGNPIETISELPGINTPSPPFLLTRTDLSNYRLDDFLGKTEGGS